MKEKIIYNNRLRIWFQPFVWGIAIGLKLHDHSLDPYGTEKDFKSWKFVMYILCFEVQVFLWKSKERPVE
jgi:hypothetical protein